MQISLHKRRLRKNEIDLINREIKKFYNPVFLSKTHWNELVNAYVAEVSGEIVGICSIAKINDWFKLGPFIVFEKYQGKGIGKMIFKKISDENRSNNLFIGSRNPGVWSIAKGLGFREETNKWVLPNEVKFYLLKSLLWVFNLNYISELLRKKSTKEGPFKLMLRRKEL